MFQLAILATEQSGDPAVSRGGTDAVACQGFLYRPRHGFALTRRRLSALPVFVILILRRVVARQPVIGTALGGLFPLIGIGPPKRQRQHRARCGECGKRGKGLPQNLTLQFRLMRLARGVPERVVEKRGPWRIHRLRDVQSTGYTQGGNPNRFRLACDQPNGLMTHRSSGHEQRGIDPLRLQSLDNARR